MPRRLAALAQLCRSGEVIYGHTQSRLFQRGVLPPRPTGLADSVPKLETAASGRPTVTVRPADSRCRTGPGGIPRRAVARIASATNHERRTEAGTASPQASGAERTWRCSTRNLNRSRRADLGDSRSRPAPTASAKRVMTRNRTVHRSKASVARRAVTRSAGTRGFIIHQEPFIHATRLSFAPARPPSRCCGWARHLRLPAYARAIRARKLALRDRRDRLTRRALCNRRDRRDSDRRARCDRLDRRDLPCVS